MASFKRPRSPPEDTSPSPIPSPTLKAARTSASPRPHSDADHFSHPSTSSDILCTLPPTCHPPHRPTRLAGTRDLELHYAKYHAHVCEERGCGCVFPDAHLLSLHQTECHDTLAAVRKERGEKIFACHLAACARAFSTPKTRRLHLIQAHGYPKEYFFAVTNKGVGGLLKRWGDGASMLRRPWKARDDPPPLPQKSDDDDDDEEDEDTERAGDTEPDPVIDDDDDDGDEILLGRTDVHDVHPRAPTVEKADAAPAKTSTSTSRAKGPRTRRPPKQDGAVDTLADALDSLSLVPPSIRFGRGAKRGPLQHERGRGRGHFGGGGPMDVDAVHDGHPRGRGRGRSRGRGGPPIPRGGALRAGPRGRGRGAAVVRG